MANKEFTLKGSLNDKGVIDINSLKLEIKGPPPPKPKPTGQNIILILLLSILAVFLINREFVGDYESSETRKNSKLNLSKPGVKPSFCLEPFSPECIKSES
ncbi:MAG: hypothetical protein WBA93_12375 [Microcoleaceae cyanobacterium]